MIAHLNAGVLAGELTTLVVGSAFLYALGLARGLRALRLVGLAYLAGWAVLGISVDYTMMAGAGFGLETVYTVSAALVVGLVVVGRIVPAVPERRARPSRGPAARVAVVAGSVVIVVAALSALVVSARGPWPPDADTVALWVPHAGVIYHHGLWVGISGWNDTYHPEYPPLISTMYALSFALGGGYHPSLLPLAQCLLGLSFVASMLALLDRCVSRAIAFPSVGLLLVAPEFFTRLDSLLPDQTLAYFVATAGLACVLWLRERRGAWLVLAVVLSGAGTFTKGEGLSYALLLALVIAAVAWRLLGRRAGLAALTLFLGAAAIEPWRLWLSAHHFPQSSTDYSFSSILHPVYLAHRAGRIDYSVREVLHVMFSPGRWLVILPIVIAAIVVAARRSPILAAASASWLVLAFCGLIYIYWAGTFPFTLRDEVMTSAHRVASTIVIVAAGMVPLLLGLAGDRDRS